MLFKTAHHDGGGTHPAPFRALTRTHSDIPPIRGNVAAGGAAGLLLPGQRSRAAQRAASPESTPRLVRLFAVDGRRFSAAAARAAAALPRLVAAAARRLHGGPVLRSPVPQQLSPHSELLSVLGRVVGKLCSHHRAGTSPGLQPPLWADGLSIYCGGKRFIILLVFPSFKGRTETLKCNKVRVVVSWETYLTSAAAV